MPRPALAGADFRRAWQGRAAQELHECTRTTMPPGRVGTLNEEQVASLVAVILDANELPPRATQ